MSDDALNKLREEQKNLDPEVFLRAYFCDPITIKELQKENKKLREGILYAIGECMSWGDCVEHLEKLIEK